MEGWLTRIANNTCLNIIRGAKRRPELIISDLSEDESNWLERKLADVATQQYRSAENEHAALTPIDCCKLIGEDRLPYDYRW